MKGWVPDGSAWMKIEARKSGVKLIDQTTENFLRQLF